MISNIWTTLYSKNFDTSKYLYHYTTFDTALKIIDSDSILFSHLNNTNDTSEAKIKVIFSPEGISSQEEYNKYVNSITNYFEKHNKLIQLLCFSMDTNLDSKDIDKKNTSMHPKEKYYDISGRGFALPRMWAQYGDNSKGVCIVVDKEKLLELINKKICIKKHGPVIYRPFYDSYIISKKMMDDLYEKISSKFNGSYPLLNLINDDHGFLQNNYFEKNIDWKNENEFRIITLVNEQTSNERVPINDFSSALRGIVLGENIDTTNEKLIRLLIKNKNESRLKPIECEIKRITFTNRLYKLK